MTIETDGDGFLLDPSSWTEEIAEQLAANDGVQLTEEHWLYINTAREMYQRDGVVPPIRIFAQHFGMDRKAQPLYDLFITGPMKRIAKWSGLPKPTGCV
jgi:tRNA 2-thiouridine synthesizing protein E